MDFRIHKNIKDNDKLRHSFIELAIKTFNLSFEDWYQNGYWTDKYIPYTIVSEEKVIANASVNIIDTVWQQTPKRYIQIGTVMTDESYRFKGLSRYLIEAILKDWQDKCDAIYLYANDTVLDFYPKFGFVKVEEYQYILPIIGQNKNSKKLDMSFIEDRALLKKYYTKSNPFSALPMLNNYGLLMFYCSAFMKDCVYYCHECDAIIIATQEEDTLMCFDIFCDEGTAIHDILAFIASKSTGKVVLGFTPKVKIGYEVNIIDEKDTTLFVLKSKENIFSQNKVMLPSLSHA